MMPPDTTQDEQSANIDQTAQALLEETDTDSRTRTYTGASGIAVTVLLCVWTAFQLWFSTVGVMSAVNLRAFHCMFLLLFTFLLYPAHKKENRIRRAPPVYDLALIVLAVGAFGYFVLHYTDIARTGGRVNTQQLVIAAVALLVVFEAARRTAPNLAILAAIFLAYNFFGAWIPGQLGHNGFTLKRVLITQFWGTQGVLGVGIGVSATYIFLFVVFGAFLKYSGFSKFINDFSLTLVGQTPGGPAKVAVIASALMGMINGSAVANVATTGTITIPLMKQTGYKKEFAGAVEATASTGGQFCPPIMGAVGFVMAEFLNLSYTKVMVAAILPAFLYYLGILMSVHFEAKRLGLSGLAKENIPDALNVIKKQGHLVLPLVVLIVIMLLGFTPLLAAVIAIFVTIGASWLRKETRMTGDKILAACVEGARGAIGVGISCVIIGVIIGTVTLTSLGLNMGYLILRVVPGNIYLTGFLVMIMSTILGMGVPGVAAYVIVQAVAVPVLIKVGIMPIAAHMFCLIYACLSNITPPVAISCYVAAGIAGSNQLKTGLVAVRLGLIGFLMPFFFLGNPILLIGSDAAYSVGMTLWASLTASIGTVALVAGLEGWFVDKANWLQRTLLIAVAPLFLYPGVLTDAIGFAVLAAVIVWQVLLPRIKSDTVVHQKIQGQWITVSKKVVCKHIKNLRADIDISANPPITDKKTLEVAFTKIGSVKNKCDGRMIVFPSATAGKIITHTGFPYGQLVPVLATLLQNAILVYSEPEIRREGHTYHPNIDAYNNYVNKVKLNGEEYYIRFTVRENKVGKKFPQKVPENNVHSFIATKAMFYATKKANLRNLTGYDPAEPQSSPLDIRLARLLSDVKKNSNA